MTSNNFGKNIIEV